ncbi:MAG: formate dehydrogenase accessory sulfurtransferase FdhD [Salinisphaera sp.]|nr:formate dehydrogenase accessory sulfurtransferase FdhD [Salinisphaera sp.]
MPHAIHSRPSIESAADAGRLPTPILAFEQGALVARDDELAVERALEIHVAGARPLITMRTPGDDRALAAGLLYGEGVINTADDIVYLKHSPDEPDVIRLMLKPSARARLDRIERSTVATSACGVCGKPSFSPPRSPPTAEHASELPALSAARLLTLPAALRSGQGVFSATGGLHAAAIFNAAGQLIDLCEDVGRHNALDKLVGAALLDDRLPWRDRILLLSGRASYELLQKSVMAGLTMVCALSAPSSYAVALAREFDITLVGFLRGDRFNIYAGEHRIIGDHELR